MKIEPATLFDASFNQFITFSLETNSNSIENLYSEMMLAYYQGDTQQLENLKTKCSLLNDLSLSILFDDMIKFRIKIRDKRLEIKDIRQLINKYRSIRYPLDVWKGEIYFIIGYGFTVIRLHNESYKFFQKAHIEYEKIGAQNKSLKALLNTVNALGNINGQRTYFFELQKLCKTATKLSSKHIASIGFLNLSYEFEKIGALRSAEYYCDKAINSSKIDEGVLHSSLAHAQKCNLSFKKGHIQFANSSLEELKLSTLPEIYECIRIIKWLYQDGELPTITKSTPNSWAARMKTGKTNKINLSSLENSCIEFLSHGPRSKYECIKHLYGTTVEYEMLDNRFSTLVSRINNKVSSLIKYDHENKNYLIK